MVKTRNATRTRAPKVTAAQANTFICRLLDPLPDAELADPALARLEAKARSAFRTS